MADDASPLADPAQALKPHRFTWDEVVRLAAADVFGPTTRVELIAGELYPMPEEGYLHVDSVFVLQRWLLTHVAPLGFDIRIREPVHFSDGTVMIPDLSVFPAGTDARGMLAARAALIIEVQDTTGERDRKLKLPRFAAERAAEVWFVDARAKTVEVFRPDGEGWGPVASIVAGSEATPACAPGKGFDPASLPDAGDEGTP